MFSNIRNIHFVGIGGIGMSGIAEILINRGFHVTGSDKSLTEVTEHLTSLGAIISKGHSPDHVKDSDVLVYSSAVTLDNPEVQEAMHRGIPVIRRAEMLAEVMRLNYGIGVAGTHGKTTTTSLIGLVLIEAGLDPTVIVGGKLHGLGGTNARLGKGNFTVVEADEFDRSFLQLSPTIAVLTTLEEEHLDIYSDLNDIKNAFIEFANKVPFYGFVVLCLDEAALQEIRPQIKKKTIAYGLTSQSDVHAIDLVHKDRTTQFTVIYHQKEIGRITLQMPGEHNIKNALASIAVGLEVNVPFETIRRALEKFTGVFRRFEIKGEVNGIMVVDDYAHHPTEVRETLRGMKAGWRRRVITVFQPHTYTRTRDFSEQFGRAFFNTDTLIVTDVYPAREQPIQGITGATIVDAAKKYGHKDARYVQDKKMVADALMDIVQPGDIVLTMGAGDIYMYGNEFLERLKKK